VGVMAFADRTVRAVTHLDVSPEQCDHAGAVLVTAAEQTD